MLNAIYCVYTLKLVVTENAIAILLPYISFEPK